MMKRVLTFAVVVALPFALSIAIATPSTSRAQTVAAPSAAVPVKAPPRAPGKIGFVDVDRCFGETEDGLRAKAMLRKVSERRQAAIAVVEDRIKAEQDSVQQLQQTVGPGPKLTNAALALQRHTGEYQTMVRQVNLELQRREDELYAPIEKKVKTIFERIGAEEGFDLIVDKKAMPSAKNGLDLTDRIIHEYNWGVTPAAAPASASASASH